ncbi:MAG: hypothetical protein KTQ12_11190, partial [Dermatophilaceae bacterium]|nr:hypothetical protein [Dermatophilaceae bacterium]
RKGLQRLGLTDAVVTEHTSALLEEPVLTVDLRFAPKPARTKAARREGARSSKQARSVRKARSSRSLIGRAGQPGCTRQG